MCGIVGIWDPKRAIENIRVELHDAVSRLRHRGPDDQDVWFKAGGVGFGHTRLSIIDLSPTGHQPMKSADGRYVIVYNGEIYNHEEIRAELEVLGHAFVGRSDTEVILHAMQEWGKEAVNKFIGIFAIALWDEREQSIELIRDRIGVKPLYFGWHNGVLCFASELKALRAFSHWRPAIDRKALGEYFQYGYISEDRCIYQGVYKLKPGHRLLLTKGRQPIVEQYWTVLNALREPLRGDDAEIEEELEALLVSAAKYRMVSDVPVGVYLSGGIDSSLVTALLAKHHDSAVRTFTIGFREDSHDESRWARKIAEHCGTRHTEYVLEAPEALEIAKSWGTLFDEPFGDSSGIPTLLVSRLARSDVKVVLSADGGDELFSGYNIYTGVLNRLNRLRRIPGPIRSIGSALLSVAGTQIRPERGRRLRRLQSMLRDPTVGRLFDLDKSYLNAQDINRLIGGGYVAARTLADTYPGNDAEKMGLWDFHHYLPEDILTKVDRMTMAASIEGREPLLDHRLAEFAYRVPAHLKRGPLGPKQILKSILYRHVPRELLERRKWGFAIPLDRWLRHELRDLVMDHLSEQRLRASGILDAGVVSRITDDFFAGSERLRSAVWFLLAFEMWRKEAL